MDIYAVQGASDSSSELRVNLMESLVTCESVFLSNIHTLLHLFATLLVSHTQHYAKPGP